MVDNPIFNDWHEKNDWYLSDDDLSTYANGVVASHPEIRALPYRDQLRAVERKVKEAFPQKFKNIERERAAAVDGGELRSGRMLRSGKPSYRTLPADARKACDRFVEQGVMTKEQYVKTFFEGDE